MMASEGWKMLMEDVERALDAVNQVDYVTGETDLYFKKGQIDQMRWLLRAKDRYEAAYLALQVSEGL
jgi:hypothetical protein